MAALSLFVALYLATFLLAGYLTAAVGVHFNHWVMLLSVSVATIGTVFIIESGIWQLGLFVAPRLASREFLLGCGAAVLLIGAADGLVMLSTRLRHVAGNGFPWIELVAVYLPAVFHEELLFRGYPFQKLWRTNRTGAVIFMSLVFAALGGGTRLRIVARLCEEGPLEKPYDPSGSMQRHYHERRNPQLAAAFSIHARIRIDAIAAQELIPPHAFPGKT